MRLVNAHSGITRHYHTAVMGRWRGQSACGKCFIFKHVRAVKNVFNSEPTRQSKITQMQVVPDNYVFTKVLIFSGATKYRNLSRKSRRTDQVQSPPQRS